MKTDNLALTIVAIVLFPFVSFFILGFVGFFVWEGYHVRDDLTAEQQKEIAYALGFDMLPGEKLTVSYEAGSWPKTISTMWGDISGVPSEEEFLLRCHDETEFYWEGHYDLAEREYSHRPQFHLSGENYPGNEDDIAAIKKVQGTVNNRLLPWVYEFFFWGCVAAEAGLIVVLIKKLVNRRKAKKEIS